MMNYNEFKAALCAKCANNRCAGSYGCNFTETYEVYLTLSDEINTLESKCKDLIDSAEWGEEYAKEFNEAHPELGNSGDVFRRIAKLERDKAAALLPEIRRRKEKIALLMDTTKWFFE